MASIINHRKKNEITTRNIYRNILIIMEEQRDE